MNRNNCNSIVSPSQALEEKVTRILNEQMLKRGRLELPIDEVLALCREFSEPELLRTLDILEHKKIVLILKHYDWLPIKKTVKFGVYVENPKTRELKYVELGEYLRETYVIDEKSGPKSVGLVLRANLAERGLICPDCGSERVQYEPTLGETYCYACGCVLQDREMVSDYRDVSAPRDPLRFDYLEMRRLRRELPYLYRYIYSKQERDLLRFMARLNMVCDRTNVPVRVKLLAYSIYNSAYSDGVLGQGVERAPYVKATLVLASNVLRIPIRTKLFSDGEREEESVRRALRRLCSSARVNSLIDPLKQAYGIVQPFDCIPYIIRNLNTLLRKRGLMPLKTFEQESLLANATRVLQALSESRMTRGTSPFVLATVALYNIVLSRKMHIPLVMLARAAGISPETICRYNRELGLAALTISPRVRGNT